MKTVMQNAKGKMQKAKGNTVRDSQISQRIICILHFAF